MPFAVPAPPVDFLSCSRPEPPELGDKDAEALEATQQACRGGRIYMIALLSLSTNQLTLKLFWELGQGVPTWKLSNYDFSPNVQANTCFLR